MKKNIMRNINVKKENKKIIAVGLGIFWLFILYMGLSYHDDWRNAIASPRNVRTLQDSMTSIDPKQIIAGGSNVFDSKRLILGWMASIRY